MNIFYFHNNPETCAAFHCDKHVVKMCTEYAQILSTAHRVLDGEEFFEIKNGRKYKRYQLSDDARNDTLYKSTHINHPSVKWARNSRHNYLWLFQMWLCLCKEYTRRYGKHHKAELLSTLLAEPPKSISNLEFTAPWRAMPDEFKLRKDTIDYCEKSYQQYFNNTKQHIAKWKTNEIPNWFIQQTI